MFHFSPFGSLTGQRRAILTTTDFAPIPLHPAVEQALQKAHRVDHSTRGQLRTTWQLFRLVLHELRTLVRDLVLWTCIFWLLIIASVLVARTVFKSQPPLMLGLFLCLVFFVSKVLLALLDYRNANRRLQIHRGVQVSLYRLINEKLALIAPQGRAVFSKGQLKTLIGSDVEAIEDFISAALMQWTPALVSIAVLLPALWFVSGGPGIIALGVALAIIPIAAIGAMFVERLQEAAQAEQDKLSTAVGEWVKNIRVVRFLGWSHAIEREINSRMWSFIWRAGIRHAAIICVWALSFSWSMCPLLVIIALSLSSATPLNLVEVFSSFWLLEHLMFQIQNIPHSLSLYGAACAGTERMLKLLAQPELSDYFREESCTAISNSALPVRVFLQHVTVSFDGTAAISDLSTSFDLNVRTAIVGSVGSGKTVLLEALIGELPLTRGEITIEFSDGSRGNLWTREVYAAFRKHVAFSPQQPFLSNTSMRDNIDLSGSKSFEDIQLATMLAQLSEDVALFPRNFDEEIGESGINLSGGQRQRVSLARAFMSQRPIFVLDDPLSAVDPNTERALMDSILQRAKGLILVSHRLAELERCDRVLVLERGKIIEDGEPKKLAQDNSSHFSRFLLALEEHGH